MCHKTNEIGKVHSGQCLVEISNIALRDRIRQRPCTNRLLLQELQNLCSLPCKSHVFRLRCAKPIHQGNQFATLEALNDRPLPLVKLWCLFKVWQVAVDAPITILTIALQEIDARSSTRLWMPKATLAWQHPLFNFLNVLLWCLRQNLKSYWLCMLCGSVHIVATGGRKMRQKAIDRGLRGASRRALLAEGALTNFVPKLST